MLGKAWSLEQHENVVLENPGSVLCHHDYTTRLPIILNNQVMGQGMTGTPLVGMEEMVVRFKEKNQTILNYIGTVGCRMKNNRMHVHLS